MKDIFKKPKEKNLICEDKKLYVTLANYFLTEGHVVIIWKKRVTDLHLLKKKDYEHLMNVVDKVRNAMLRVLKVKKVYLIYMDETKHVHWHLVPRYNVEGFDVFNHKPKKLRDFSLVEKLRNKIT